MFRTLGFVAALLMTAAAQAAVPADTVLLSSGKVNVTEGEYQQSLAALDAQQRSRVTATRAHVEGFLRSIYQQKRMVAEAERLGLPQQPDVKAKLHAARRDVLINALHDHLEAAIKTPDFMALAHEYYQTHTDQYHLPQQYRVAYILFKVNCPCQDAAKRKQAMNVLQQLRNGADFAALARKDSEDSGTAARGGKIGRWVGAGDLVKPLAGAVSKLKVGQISGLVKSDAGYQIVKLLAERQPRTQTFDAVKGNLIARIKDNYKKDQLRQKAISYLPGKNAHFNQSGIKALVKGQ